MFPEFSFMRQLVIGVIVRRFGGIVDSGQYSSSGSFCFLGIAAVGIYDFWQWIVMITD